MPIGKASLTNLLKEQLQTEEKREKIPIKRWCPYSSLVPDKGIKFIARATASQWLLLKISFFKDFQEKLFSLLEAKYQAQHVETPKI